MAEHESWMDQVQTEEDYISGDSTRTIVTFGPHVVQVAVYPGGEPELVYAASDLSHRTVQRCIEKAVRFR